MYCLHKCLTKIKIGWKYHSFVSAVWSLTSVGKQTIFYKGHIPFHPQLDAVTLWSKTPLKEPAVSKWFPWNWQSETQNLRIEDLDMKLTHPVELISNLETALCTWCLRGQPDKTLSSVAAHPCLTKASMIASTMTVPSPWLLWWPAQ